MAAGFLKSQEAREVKTERAKRKPESFCNLISEATSITFAKFCSLEVSLWVQPSLQGTELGKSKNVGRWGYVGATSEAAYLVRELPGREPAPSRAVLRGAEKDPASATPWKPLDQARLGVNMYSHHSGLWHQFF